MVNWKIFGNKEKHENWIIAVIRRIKNDELDGFLQIKKENVGTKSYDIRNHVLEKSNKNISVNGGARVGKTMLGEYLCLTLPHRKIIISFKKFTSEKRDFDIGYPWIDVSQHVPNVFVDGQSFLEAFRTAFFADLSLRGLMIDTILTKVNDVMEQKPKSFEEFFIILEKVARKGQWDDNITTIVKSKVQLLQRATIGAKSGSVNFRSGNIVLDLGNFKSEEVKIFFAEMYLRQIARIEEEAQNEEKIYVVIDEAWHLLQARQQNSIIGTLLLQGAYYIHLLCITQNYTHIDEDYRGHFGTPFCFRNANDKDMNAIERAFGAFVRDGVRLLSDFEFIDLKYEHGEDVIPVFKLNYERVKELKLIAKAQSVLRNTEESFVAEIQEIVKPETKNEENLKEKIISVLKKSDVSLYGYQIAKAVELSSKDAVKVRQPLRELLNEGKLIEDKLQLRKKVVTYYSLPDTEQFHNLMLKETEKENIACTCRIVKTAVRGVSEPDFEIEKNEKVYYQECETGRKKSLGEFDKRLEGYDKPVIIVIPNEEIKERYSYLVVVNSGKAKVCLIPEMDEVLKTWTK